MKTNFNNADVLNRFISICTSFQIHHQDLMEDDGKMLPLNSLDDFNQGIGLPFGYDAYKTEKGALKLWNGMLEGYRDGVAIQNNQRVQHEAQANAASIEAGQDTTESKEAETKLVEVEKAIGKLASDMLKRFKKADSEYSWHGLVIPCREYITLGRRAGRNSVETMAEIRAHVYDLAKYSGRVKPDTEKADTVDLDAEHNKAFEVNSTFENNVTRSIKCALLSERGDIDLSVGDLNGKPTLQAPFNQLKPIVKMGGKEVANTYSHLVAVSIREMEALYAEKFQGKKRGTKKVSVASVAESAATLAANVSAYDDMKPEQKGDIETAAQAFLTSPDIMGAIVKGTDGVKIIKTFQEALENIDLTDDTVEALVNLASTIDVVVDGYTGTKDGEAAEAAQA